MFSLLNAVPVIPVASVDFVQQTLARTGIDVPVLLKAHQEKAGWMTLCGWIPGQTDPVYQDLPTEVLVCNSARPELQTVLEEFCAGIKAGERGRQDMMFAMRAG